MNTLGVDYGVRRCAVVHPRRGLFASLDLERADDLVAACLLGDWLYSHVVRSSPDVVCIESPIVGASRNYQVGLRMAMVAGALVVAARQAGSEPVLVPPSTWKRRTVGRGNASKQEVSAWLLGADPGLHARCVWDQDLIDATCIALGGLDR